MSRAYNGLALAGVSVAIAKVYELAQSATTNTCVRVISPVDPDGRLCIVNERGDTYLVDVKTRGVSAGPGRG